MLLDHLLRAFSVGTSSHFALRLFASSESRLIHSKYEGNATTIQNGLASLSAAKNYPLQKNESNKLKNLTILHFMQTSKDHQKSRLGRFEIVSFPQGYPPTQWIPEIVHA